MTIRASDRRKIVLDEKKRCNRDNWDYCFIDRAHLSTFIAKFLFYIYLQTYTYNHFYKKHDFLWFHGNYMQ